jgi:hypothetical protein
MFRCAQGPSAPASVPPARPRDWPSARGVFAKAKRNDGQVFEKARDDEIADFAAAADERRSLGETKRPASFPFVSFRLLAPPLRASRRPRAERRLAPPCDRLPLAEDRVLI